MLPLEKRVVEAYSDGSPIKLIKDSFNLTEDEVKHILINYKEENRHKNSFTDDFKRIIAERDINGVSRRQIALELKINVNTVRNACEQFGQILKEKAPSENLYTRIDRKLDLSTCPTCNSKKVNVVDCNTTFCLNCDNEHVHYEDYANRINWEYID